MFVQYRFVVAEKRPQVIPHFIQALEIIVVHTISSGRACRVGGYTQCMQLVSLDQNTGKLSPRMAHHSCVRRVGVNFDRFRMHRSVSSVLSHIRRFRPVPVRRDRPLKRRRLLIKVALASGKIEIVIATKPL
jgi:hypothetical protein